MLGFVLFETRLKAQQLWGSDQGQIPNARYPSLSGTVHTWKSSALLKQSRQYFVWARGKMEPRPTDAPDFATIQEGSDTKRLEDR